MSDTPSAFELKSWANSLLKMAMTWEKLRPMLHAKPNAPQMRTALRWFDSEVLLRELQRRKALPKFPKVEAEDGMVVDEDRILKLLDDDVLIKECADRDIYIPNPDAVILIARGIDALDWGEVKDGYAKL